MGDDLSDEIRRRLVGRSLEWIKRFDAADYEGNRPMIEKLFEEKQLALVQAMSFEDEAALLRAEVTALKLERQRLQLAVLAQQRIAWLQAVLSFLAIILSGLGVNLVSGSPGDGSGWVLVAAAAVLEAVVFATGIKESRNRHADR